MVKSETLNFGITPKSFAHILQALENTPGLEKAVIFGSRAMGNFKNGSDVDIAIYGNITHSDFQELVAELNERRPVPYRCDVVDYNNISNPDLKKHIDEFGKTLHLNK